jgi:hypothetical protein
MADPKKPNEIDRLIKEQNAYYRDREAGKTPKPLDPYEPATLQDALSQKAHGILKFGKWIIPGG